MYHSFLIHSSADGHLGCFHVLAKQCCDEHWGTHVSFNSGFLGVYAQQGIAQPVHSKGDQSWVFFGRNDAKAETPVLWPPHVKS